MTVLISSSLIDRQAGNLSGIRSRRLGRNAVEDSEYGEVSVISSENGLNTCLSVGGREECVKQSLVEHYDAVFYVATGNHRRLP